MVLNHIFSKSPDKHKSKNKDKEKDRDKEKKDRDHRRGDSIDPVAHRIVIPPPPPPKSPEPRTSPTGSPRKSSSTTPSPRKSPTKSSHLQHSRSSSTTSKRSFTISRRRRPSRDQDSHPLNLPPDELRRLTAMAAREDARSSMDVEESPSSTTSAPVTSPAQGETPAATNGASPAQEDRSPTPPPHRTSPPAPDAESFKLAGNKFYKAGDYNRAIQEYNKGRWTILRWFLGGLRCENFPRMIVGINSATPEQLSKLTPTPPRTYPTARLLIFLQPDT